MDEVLDESLFEREKPSVTYGGFWQRVGALILDGIILTPVVFGLTYVNVVTWKSPLVLILASLAGIAYKPLMEYVYGATWGKMAVKLVVKNRDLEKAELGEILVRNVFHIVFPLISLYFTVMAYNDPGFESVSGFMAYSTFINGFAALKYVNFTSTFIDCIDAIVLASDKQKRSLHDQIAGTVVIVQNS